MHNQNTNTDSQNILMKTTTIVMGTEIETAEIRSSSSSENNNEFEPKQDVSEKPEKHPGSKMSSSNPKSVQNVIQHSCVSRVQRLGEALDSLNITQVINIYVQI